MKPSARKKATGPLSTRGICSQAQTTAYNPHHTPWRRTTPPGGMAYGCGVRRMFSVRAIGMAVPVTAVKSRIKNSQRGKASGSVLVISTYRPIQPARIMITAAASTPW